MTLRDVREGLALWLSPTRSGVELSFPCEVMARAELAVEGPCARHDVARLAAAVRAESRCWGGCAYRVGDQSVILVVEMRARSGEDAAAVVGSLCEHAGLDGRARLVRCQVEAAVNWHRYLGVWG